MTFAKMFGVFMLVILCFYVGIILLGCFQVIVEKLKKYF